MKYKIVGRIDEYESVMKRRLQQQEEYLARMYETTVKNGKPMDGKSPNWSRYNSSANPNSVKKKQ